MERGKNIMKVLKEMCLPILIVLFLISGITYAQSPAEENYDKGVEHAIQEKFKMAKEEFEKALKIDPSLKPVEFSLKIINDVIQQKIKTETAIHLFKGISNGNKSQYNMAISDYTMAIEINPKYAIAYYYRGIAYSNKGQHDLSISDYTMAIEINPKYAGAYNSRGIAYRNNGQHDLAISDYSMGIEINPNDAETYNNRAIAYSKKRQFDMAISDYSMAIKINPNDVETYYNRAIAYRKNHQYDMAISDYSMAIKINPNDANAYDNRGFIYIVKFAYKVKGCADWKKACELGMCANYNNAKLNGVCSQ